MSSHGQGPEHEAYAMGCHCAMCRPGSPARVEDKMLTWRQWALQREARMAPFGDRQSTVVLETDEETQVRRRREYEAWITAARKHARRERVWSRIGYGVLVILGAILLMSLVVLVNQAGAAIPQTVAQAVEEKPQLEQGGLAEARERCESAGGEWLEDDRSAIMIPGTKVVGCFWIVPKEMK